MLNINFAIFPKLETERLHLRRVVTDDAEAILELRGNPETMKYIPRPLAINLEDAKAHIAQIDSKIENNEGINWAITFKESQKLIGIIGHYRIQPENYRAEIGYMLLPEFQGKGLTSEAIKAVVNYGFYEMKLHSIEAILDPKNIASEKVLIKNGFVKEGLLKECEYYDGRFLDKLIYSILKKINN